MRNKLRAGERGGIMVGVLIFAVVLVAVAAIISINVARTIHVDTVSTKDGDNVSIKTPAGNFSIQAHEHGGKPMIDVPIYPGAKQTKDAGGADFQWTSADGGSDKGFSVAGAEMVTNDPAARVFDYYHDKLPSWIVSHESNGTIKLEEAPGARGLEPRRFVAIREKSDGTHIGVASIGTPASN